MSDKPGEHDAATGTRWFCERDGKTDGPYTPEEAVELAREQAIAAVPEYTFQDVFFRICMCASPAAVEAAVTLLPRAADIAAEDALGRNAMHYARWNTRAAEIVSVLERHGCPGSLPDLNEEDQRIFYTNTRAGEDTPEHAACMRGKTEHAADCEKQCVPPGTGNTWHLLILTLAGLCAGLFLWGWQTGFFSAPSTPGIKPPQTTPSPQSGPSTSPDKPQTTPRNRPISADTYTVPGQ